MWKIIKFSRQSGLELMTTRMIAEVLTDGDGITEAGNHHPTNLNNDLKVSIKHRVLPKRGQPQEICVILAKINKWEGVGNT